MVFNELYSAYYNTVAKIIRGILDGKADADFVRTVIRENAFEESMLYILPAIREEKWQVVTKDFKTPIRHDPSMPLTALQKRWLKAILADERIQLFDICVNGLEDVEPLFTKEDYCVYDRYADGDDFEDEGYVQRFKCILYAIRGGLPVKAEMTNRKGKSTRAIFIPRKLEYSEKDDKFRVLVFGCRHISIVNLARLTSCVLYEGSLKVRKTYSPKPRSSVTLLVKDERNALERVLLHFAHFEKRAERADGNDYKVTVKYDVDDESEMVIRVLSFGPLVEVAEPSEFRQLIVEKLKKQQSCGLK